MTGPPNGNARGGNGKGLSCAAKARTRLAQASGIAMVPTRRVCYLVTLSEKTRNWSDSSRLAKNEMGKYAGADGYADRDSGSSRYLLENSIHVAGKGNKFVGVGKEGAKY